MGRRLRGEQGEVEEGEKGEEGRRVRGEQGEVEEGEEGDEDKRGGGGEQGEGKGGSGEEPKLTETFFSIFVYIKCNKLKKI